MSALDDVLIAEAARLDALPADLRVVELVKLSASLPVLVSVAARLEKGEDVAQDEIDALAKGRGGKAISSFVAYLGQKGRRLKSSIKASPIPGKIKAAVQKNPAIVGSAIGVGLGAAYVGHKVSNGALDTDCPVCLRSRARIKSLVGVKPNAKEQAAVDSEKERAAQVAFDAKWPMTSPADRKRKAEAAGFKIADKKTMAAARAKAGKDGRAGRDADGDGKRGE